VFSYLQRIICATKMGAFYGKTSEIDEAGSENSIKIVK
jgi:hypothetical protein